MNKFHFHGTYRLLKAPAGEEAVVQMFAPLGEWADENSISLNIGKSEGKYYANLDIEGMSVAHCKALAAVAKKKIREVYGKIEISLEMY